MGCRFPGARNPREFWTLLASGRDAIAEVPAHRRGPEALSDEKARASAPAYGRWGGFLDRVDEFDPAFFRLSVSEARTMDPQQRLLLEVTWEALENAGIRPGDLAGRRVGVFVGAWQCDYEKLQKGPIPRGGTGLSRAILANRLSHVFDLRGPSLMVDTACSSSLVALDLAAQSLSVGACDLAIVGGVNLILTSDITRSFSEMGVMASDGRCKVFDSRADGYVRSEGCGVVVLKRLEDSLEDHDNVLAIVRGTASGQDGDTATLTSPSEEAQTDVMRQALSVAGLKGHDISFIEAHGTGTPVGDPIEFGAMKTVYGALHDSRRSCALGSVKTNIGHLESAAGVAGLIKAVLALQNATIPANLHFRELNPDMSLEGTPFILPVGPMSWDFVEGPRRAAVSSLGYGGTIAHAILEEAPGGPEAPLPSRKVWVLACSAPTAAGLERLVPLMAEATLGLDAAGLAAAAGQSLSARTPFSHRLAFTCSSAEEARKKLLNPGVGLESVTRGRVTQRTPPKVALLFSPQGSARTGMGRELYEAEPLFRKHFDQVAQVVERSAGLPLIEALHQGSKGQPITEPVLSHVAVFSVEYALARLWLRWGLRPSAVLGHSAGEYTAACISGALSLEDTVSLLVARGRAMNRFTQDGMMAAVSASQAEVQGVLSRLEARAEIAALNGPTNTVIAGTRTDVERVLAHFEAEGVLARSLDTPYAGHCFMVEPLLPVFQETASQIAGATPRLALYSTVDGARREGVLDSAHWGRHLRQPVRYAAAIEAALADGIEIFLECGPSDSLADMGRRATAGRGLWLASLGAPGEQRRLMESVAALFVRGASLDWDAVAGGRRPEPMLLPNYPFERQPCWFDPS